MKREKFLCLFICMMLCLGAAMGIAAEKQIDNLIIKTRMPTSTEIQKLKEMWGTFEPGKNYNKIVDGHGTGLKPPTEKQWQEMADKIQFVESVKRIDGKDRISASADLTTSIYFPPIGNQGAEGSCVCFSTIYYIKTFQEAKEHGWNLSGATWIGGYTGYPTPSYQDRIMSPDFVYHQVNGGIDGGSNVVDIADLLDHMGVSSWETMPYDSSDHTSWPPEDAWREAPIYRGIGEVQLLTVQSATGLDDLKTLIDNQRLTSISVDSTKMYEMTTTDQCSGYSFDHNVTVVGYDDNKSYTEDGATHYGAFKIANSWGDTWTLETTNDGCFWISYNAMKENIVFASYSEDKTSYNPKMLAVFQITHPDRSDCLPYVYIGGSDEILWSGMAPSSSVSIGWNDFTVSPALDVDTDEMYKITVASSQLYSASNYYSWRQSAADSYAGDSNAVFDADFCFRTYTTGDVLDQSQETATYQKALALDYPSWQNILPSASPITKISLNLDYSGSPGYVVTTISDAPSASKQFMLTNQGSHAYPSNKIALDITEFYPYYNSGDKDFYLKIQDTLDAKTGTATWFSIEVYDNYFTGTPEKTFVSSDAPKATLDGDVITLSATEPLTGVQAPWQCYE